MKATKVEDIRKLSAQELNARLADTREELMKLRFQQVSGQLTDTSKLRIMRRDIARMETILAEFGRVAVTNEGAE